MLLYKLTREIKVGNGYKDEVKAIYSTYGDKQGDLTSFQNIGY